MSIPLINRNPSRGLLRFLLRLPILLYHLRLGWLLGHRFLLLKHKGRKTNLQRETVLEVVRYDKDAEVYLVASGWGEHSQWYKNIMHNSRVEIQSGCRRMKAIAERVSEERAEEELSDYARRHPVAYRELGKRLLGETIRGQTEGYRKLAKKIPIIAIGEDGMSSDNRQAV